jgi:hypothetical protein
MSRMVKHDLTGPHRLEKDEDTIWIYTCGQSKNTPSWQKGSGRAITLTHEPSVRVLLTVPQKGNPLREHHAGGPLTSYALSGAMVCGTRAGALERQESRGGHTRDDDPMADDRFGKVNVVIRPKNNQFSMAQEPLPEMPGELKARLQERK